MIQAPFNYENETDDFLPKLIAKRKSKHVKTDGECEEDTFWILTGDVRSGKSTLGKHIINDWCDGKAYAHGICLHTETFLEAHKIAIDLHKKDKPRYVMFDEANINKFLQASKEVRSIVSLYNTNAVFGICHIWCWPDVNQFPKDIGPLRATGIFFVIKYDANKPRFYIYWPREEIKRMIADRNDLTNDNLKRLAAKYNTILGRFKKYKGILNHSYISIKLKGATQVFNNVYESLSKKKKETALDNSTPLGCTKVSRLFDMPVNSAQKWLAKVDREGRIKTKTISGYRLKPEDVPKFKEILQTEYNRAVVPKSTT